MKTQTKIQVLQENMDQKKILKVFDRFAQSYHSFQRVHSVLPPPPPGIGGGMIFVSSARQGGNC